MIATNTYETADASLFVAPYHSHSFKYIASPADDRQQHEEAEGSS